MLHTPALVVHSFLVCRLERIGSKIEEFGQPQWFELVLPYVEAMRPLLREDDLPLLIAQSDKRAVVYEVDEFRPGGM